MALEAGTYFQDLDIANPPAGDKKNQGDDHLRLIKTTAKNTFPNADRPFRFPEVLSKTLAYVVVAADDNKTILCDTTAGDIALTLPTPTFDGWLVRVIKTSVDANPVFVSPPSGTINGAFARIRCNVPFVEYVFVWTGSVFVRVKAPGETPPGALEQFAGALPVGFALATGQSLVRLDYPELFAAWGTTWGSVDGTHFTAPDVRDRFVVGAGSAYAITVTGGEATHVLLTAELPVHSHANVLNDPGHFHLNGKIQSNGLTAAVSGPSSISGWDRINGEVSLTNMTLTNANAGSGTAHENRPPYLGLNQIFRLC